MKILMTASELSPFASTGRLGRDVSALAYSLRRLKHEVSVVIPLHRSVRENARIKKTGVKFSVSVGNARYLTEIFETSAPDGTQVFLVARDEFFDRSGLYGNDSGDYQDNSARFIYFTKCALELARRMDPSPEVVHAHGWQTALSGIFARESKLAARTVFTPHGLEFQGNFWSYDFSLTNLPGEYFGAGGLEFYGSLNFLKSGLLFSDLVIMPSERFAAAAQTPTYGCGLEVVLREQSGKLYGIPDGHELENWAPETDAALPFKFGKKNPAARSGNLQPLEELMEWEPGAEATCVSFACASPGVDIFLASLDRLLAHNVRAVLFGDPGHENLRALETAIRKHQGRFTFVRDYPEETVRLALGAADFVVIPGPADPSSPWLLRAMAYGCAPIAHQCPGLFQFVTEFQPGSGSGNGFLFNLSTTDALIDACRKAIAAKSQEDSRIQIVKAAMAQDFSVGASALAHERIYAGLLGKSVTKRKAA